MVSAFAKELAHLAAVHPSNSMFREPRWTTPNRIALELPSMRLREFSAEGDNIATMVCAPLALHDATLTEFAPDHSLVAALRMAGLRNVFVTDWRSASPEMRFFSIDNYLADLNVVVDELGGCVNLIGVCQGGWMALVYAVDFGQLPTANPPLGPSLTMQMPMVLIGGADLLENGNPEWRISGYLCHSCP
jgi:poly-beta-hydroxyalkanoate depolymerase